MAEKPILFNTDMVRAILEGRKTQTRRIIKGLPLYPPFFEEDEGRGWLEDSENGSFYALEAFSKIHPGDVLWVRETWQHLFDHRGWRYVYKADYRDDEPLKLGGMYIAWRPSIHMPKGAARLFLRVTGVRCERLRDITARDAFYEGTGRLFLEDIAYGDKDYGCDLDDEYGMAREQFAWLWESTLRKNDLERYGWWANPWVWVIEFERIDKPKGWCES